jgi:hypothetical protein
MKQTQSQQQGGIGFVGLLTTVFITLKLLNVITWSWWWVLSPILIPIGLALTILLMWGFAVLVLWIFRGGRW